MKDFTLNKYRKLLESLISNNINIYGINDYLKTKPKKGVLIRHDVDRNPNNALEMAKLENSLNIQTTYYFRILKPSFNSGIIKEIYNLGHEVGYHYEDLALANGNKEYAILLFKKHLQKIHNITPIYTISMHGRPLSKHDSRDLWKKYDFKDYNINGEAFLSIDYSDFFYFTDTGRSWSDKSLNIRDKVKTKTNADMSHSDELIDFISKNREKKIALNIHPERWPHTKFGYIKSLIFDILVNFVKRLIIMVRYFYSISSFL